MNRDGGDSDLVEIRRHGPPNSMRARSGAVKTASIQNSWLSK